MQSACRGACLAPRGTLFGWSLASRQVESGVDERDVREGLREVPELASEAWIVFLGQKADIVAQGQQALEQLASLADAPLQDEVVGEPKAAGKKHPLAGRQPVDYLSGVVAANQPVDDEPALDRRDGSDDAWIGRRQKADERQEQEARVE